jgi:hypothetical protein
MVLWNPRIRDGKLEYELTKAFAILAHGVEEEEKLIAVNAPLEERNKNWLLRQNSNRNPPANSRMLYRRCTIVSEVNQTGSMRRKFAASIT